MTQIGQSNPHHIVRGSDLSAIRVTLAWASVTDTGHKRTVNEDSAVAQPCIFAVADGMGGHSAGDIASAAVVNRLAEHAHDNFVAREAIDRALVLAVDDIDSEAGTTELGTGTTVTGVALTLVDNVPHWLVFNIGDSRVYHLADAELTQLTVDHSVVQELVDAGLITRDEADVHPQGNVITRAVGFHDRPVPDYRLVPVIKGMRLLVCSDGLTKEVTDSGLQHFLTTEGAPADAAQKLLDAALNNGGRDNVTLIVVDVVDVESEGSGPESLA